jgi:hypothetical protein
LPEHDREWANLRNMKRRATHSSLPALTAFMIRTRYSPRDPAVSAQIRWWQGQKLITVQPITKDSAWIEITDRGKAAIAQ